MNTTLRSTVIILAALVCWHVGAAQDIKENADFKLAVDLYKQGMYDLAQEQLQSFIERYPASDQIPEARFTLGLVYLKTGLYDKARETFQQFALTYPGHSRAPEAWWNVALANARQRRFKEAASAFARLKTFHPRSRLAPKALLESARYYLKAGDSESATTVLRSILQEYPGSEENLRAQMELGRIYTASGDFDRARKSFRFVYNRSSDAQLRAQATIGLGLVDEKLGNRAGAEKRYRSVIDTYKGTPVQREAYVRLGDLQRKYREFTAASKTYALVFNDTTAAADIRRDALLGAAQCDYAAGDYRRAAEMYRKFIDGAEAEYLTPEIYRDAAKAAQKAGWFREADRYFTHLLKDDIPGFDKREAIVDVALNAREAGDSFSALQYLNRYVDLYPNDSGTPFALLTIGRITLQQFQDPWRAASMFLDVAERYPASPVADDAVLDAARALKSAGEAAQSARVYNRLIRQFPASEWVDDARKELADLRELVPMVTVKGLEQITRAVTALASTQPADVHLALGELYLYQLKDFTRARTEFEAARSSVNGADRAAYGLARSIHLLAKVNNQSFTEAQRLYDDFIRNYPASPLRDEAAFHRFQIAAEHRRGGAVLPFAQEFLALDPKAHLDEVLYRAGDAARRDGQYSLADDYFTRLINLDSATAFSREGLYARGVARVEAGRTAEGKTDLETYLDRHPDGLHAVGALKALSRLAERSRDYESAIQYLETVRDRFPYSSSAEKANRKIVSLLLASGRNDQARRAVETLFQAADANPFTSEDELAELLYLESVTLAKAGHRDLARQDLLKYIERFPRGKRIGDVYVALAEAFRAEGNQALATSYYQLAGRKAGNREATREAADLLLEDGKYQEAVKEYSSILSTAASPKEKAYLESRIIIALFRSDKIADALTRVEEFRRSFPDARGNFDEFELERGKYHFRQQQYDKAMDIFEEVADSDYPEIAPFGLLWMGKVYEARNRVEDAKEYFSKVIDAGKNSLAVAEAHLAMAAMY
ncbi:MAG: tetratricopeptide repeat protein, partial [Chlorobi bacterium]|nr:tetratricopeptide repeat protein [Chlorobiota bacterium]